MKNIRAEYANRSNDFHARAFESLTAKILENIKRNEDEEQVRQYENNQSLDEDYRMR